MFLLDTNVISELAPRAQRRDDVADWLELMSEHLYLSAISVAEIAAGIAKARREGATRRAEAYAEWLETLRLVYDRRILPFDQRAAVIAGEMLDRSRAYQPGFPDVAIAATAQCEGLTVLTRNIRHFEPLGVRLANPFDSLPQPFQ